MLSGKLLGSDSVKASRIRGAPKNGAKKATPRTGEFSGQTAECWRWLTNFKSLRFQESNSLSHSILKLLLFEVFGHINLEQVNRIPDFSGGKHGIDGGQNHSGNGDDCSFLAPALGNMLIFQSIIRIQLVLHGCVGDLHQHRFEINSGT